MSLKTYVMRMAHYNQWMNEKLYAHAAALAPEVLHEDRGAFFGSIFRTLNHLMVADRIWLARFAEHPRRIAALEPVRAMPHPYALDEILFPDFDRLRAARVELDAIIRAAFDDVDEADLAVALSYRNRAGQAFVKRFGDLAQHFFNHQTHHRGQVTTLFSQLGIDVGVTDLVALIPDVTA